MGISRSHIEKKAAKLADDIRHRCKPVEQISGEDIHDLRTTVKRLKALLQLINIKGDNNRLKEIFKPYKKLFKTVGELRAMQLMSASFNKVRSLNGEDKKTITQILYRRKSDASTAYKKLLKNGLKRQLKKAAGKIRKVIEHSDIKDEEAYFSERKKALIEICGAALTPALLRNGKERNELPGDEVHHARMLLKEVYYNAQFLKIKEQIPAFGISPDAVDQLLEKLGDWHDLFSNQKDYSDLVNDQKMNWQDMAKMKKMEQSLTKKEALLRRQMILHLRNISHKAE